jgi:hypothetical protein
MRPTTNPHALPNRATIRPDLKTEIAKFMDAEVRRDFSDACCALIVYGLQAKRDEKPRSTPPWG